LYIGLSKELKFWDENKKFNGPKIRDGWSIIIGRWRDAIVNHRV
jgi:hypothetical protein